MKDITKKLISLISMKAPLNQIQEELNLSNKRVWELINSLSKSGIEYGRKYYSSGDIVYYPYTNIKPQEEIRKRTIITTHKEKQITFLGISDSHIGSIYDNYEYLEIAYNFCIQNGIHIIINGGDLIDGNALGSRKKSKTSLDQINSFINTYPYDKSILNFCTLGNHDITSLLKEGIDFDTLLERKRHDIISLGYAIGIIKIKNDEILLKHYIKDIDLQKLKEVSSLITSHKLIIEGHHHFTGIKETPKYKILKLPTISDLTFNSGEKTMPGMVKCTLDFNTNGRIIGMNIENYILTPKPIRINETYLTFREFKTDYKKTIDNEEDKPRKLTIV